MPQLIKSLESQQLIDLSQVDDSEIVELKENKVGYVCGHCGGKVKSFCKSKSSKNFVRCEHILDADGYHCPSRSLDYKNSDAIKKRTGKGSYKKLPNHTRFWQTFSVVIPELNLTKKSLTEALNEAKRYFCTEYDLQFIPSDKLQKAYNSYLYHFSNQVVVRNDELRKMVFDYFDQYKIVKDIKPAHPLFAANSLVKLKAGRVKPYFKTVCDEGISLNKQMLFNRIPSYFAGNHYKNETFINYDFFDFDIFQNTFKKFYETIQKTIKSVPDVYANNLKILNDLSRKDDVFDRAYRRNLELFLLFHVLKLSEKQISEIITKYLTTRFTFDINENLINFHESNVVADINLARRVEDFHFYYNTDWSSDAI